ncbi:MAG: hypothetical protein U9Q82_07210 [Chloroflexota bacterium]|nr:hypothetical protein [Chloroflexota bacterium]
MELDFTEFEANERSLWITLVVLVGMALLGALGWFITPDGQVLDWTE